MKKIFFIIIFLVFGCNDDKYRCGTIDQKYEKNGEYFFALILSESNGGSNGENGRVYGVEIDSDFESKQVIPGGMVLYDLYITNSGDETDSFALSITSDDREGWLSNLSQLEIDDLGPDETTTVVLTIYSPEDSEEEDSLLTAIYINSKNREQFHDDLEVNTIIRLPERGVSLSSPQDSLNGNPGSTLTYTISVMNTGSDPDDIDLGFEVCDSCNAWVVSLSKYTILNLLDLSG